MGKRQMDDYRVQGLKPKPGPRKLWFSGATGMAVIPTRYVRTKGFIGFATRGMHSRTLFSELDGMRSAYNERVYGERGIVHWTRPKGYV